MTNKAQWIKWDGNGVPDVAETATVAYKLRDGDERTPQRVSALNWAHDGSFRDIVAYHEV